MTDTATEVIHEPRTPKWLRYTLPSLLHLFLLGLFLQLGICCLKLNMIAGIVWFALCFAFCVFTFLFMLNRIRKGTPAKYHKKDIPKRILIGCLAVLTVLLVVLPLVLTVYVYESSFGQRYETYAPMARHLDEFDGLEVATCTFSSDKGQKLAGYTYRKGNDAKKGVVVLAHGFGGGGHNSYMDMIDGFASDGYLVFAYDATGNDNSEGKSVCGLVQGIIDLDFAIRYVKANDEMKDLPMVLFGHSWGGYCVSAVLNLYPDVEAVAAVSGFNTSADMIHAQGSQTAGFDISAMLPYFSLYESFKFGKYADVSALGGFADSDAHIMIIHSSDDIIVAPEYGYDKYLLKYKNDSRFTFIRFADRGHNYLFYTDAARAYREQFNEEFKTYVDNLDVELTPEIKADYLNQHLDKTKLYEMDMELFSDILAFYDEAVRN